VQQHAATFIAQAEDAAGADLPQFVKDEVDAFLECGILAHGFVRLRCGDCGHDNLVAFSCKRRGVCPSCGARRMDQTVVRLVDHVFPHLPAHRWQIDYREPDVRRCRVTLQCRDWSRSVFVIQPERLVPRKLSGRTRLGHDFRRSATCGSNAPQTGCSGIN
jgi:DNA-directed RNA polymerase subunit RPC12/RpoP